MLEKFIDDLKKIVALLPTQIIGVKGLDSLYLYCSPNFAHLLGYPVAEVVGKYGMFINEINNSARINEDRQLIASKESQVFIHIDKIKGKLSPLTFIKSPIIDPETQAVIGILCQVFEFATLDFGTQILNLYKDFSLDSKAKQNLPRLTKREKQVIFLFLANLNSAEIVEVIYKLEGKKVSKGTIDCVFSDQLFPKFGVYNRQGLYAKLMQLGYNRLIPVEMLTKQTVALDTHAIY